MKKKQKASVMFSMKQDSNIAIISRWMNATLTLLAAALCLCIMRINPNLQANMKKHHIIIKVTM